MKAAGFRPLHVAPLSSFFAPTTWLVFSIRCQSGSIALATGSFTNAAPTGFPRRTPSSACRARTGDHRRRHLGLDERAASIERRPLAAGIDAALDGELQAQPDRTPTDGREQQQAEGQCGSSPPGARLVFRQAGFTIS
jgi:hypothetical protein